MSRADSSTISGAVLPSTRLGQPRAPEKAHSAMGVRMGTQCAQVRVETHGILFSSCRSVSYLSINYHQSTTGTSNPKAIWAITRKQECDTFCESEVAQWIDASGNLWYISPDAQAILGTSKERMAFFDSPVNANDPWHGYPVSSRRGFGHAKPPHALLDSWLKNGRISKVTYDRIMGGRI